MRYFLGFLIAIGLIILVIILMFRGPGEPEVPTTSKTLDSYATTNAEVSFTREGPINAESQHRGVRITVGRNNVSYEQLNGYQGNTSNQHLYDNNVDAFDAFLKALERAGYTQGNTDKSLAEVKGRCPFGDRFIFELKQDDRVLQRFWDTSCGGEKTYEGNTKATIRLFEAQIPDYDELTRDLNFSFSF